MTKAISWFSCGVASAAATDLFLTDHPSARIAYCASTLSTEHPDNSRFLADCERWFGKKIEQLYSTRYRDTWDVFARTGWLVGPLGAKCTIELKKRVRQDNCAPDEIQCFGFDITETRRWDRFRKNNPDVFDPRAPLIEHKMTKADAAAMVAAKGIEIPVMYKLGYRNNNCIGCVKGQSGYWNKIRRDFPGVFRRMAKVEREMDVAICKTEPVGPDGKRQRIRVFLDELDPNAGRYEQEPGIQCGIACEEPQLNLSFAAAPHSIP